MKIGLFSDPHESDKLLSEKNRRPSLSFEKIRVAMESFRKSGVQLVVCLGDLLDHCVDRVNEEKEFRRLSEMIRSFGIPFYCVRGNHDCANFVKSDFYRISGFRKLPFAERFGDRAFIFPDTCFHHDGTPYLPGKIDWTDSYLPPDQMEQLKQTLSNPEIKEAIILMHQRLYPNDDPRYQIRNSEEIQAVLEHSGKVHRVYCGHYHRGSLAERNGIVYTTMPAMCEGENNPYKIIEV